MQSPQDDKAALKEIHDTLRQHWELINSAFIFYPTGTSADVFHMGLNQFTALLEDCKVCPYLLYEGMLAKMCWPDVSVAVSCSCLHVLYWPVRAVCV